MLNPDQSDDEDLRLLALAILYELELDMRAEELRMLAMAGCSMAEAAASMNLDWVS